VSLLLQYLGVDSCAILLQCFGTKTTRFVLQAICFAARSCTWRESCEGNTIFNYYTHRLDTDCLARESGQGAYEGWGPRGRGHGVPGFASARTDPGASCAASKFCFACSCGRLANAGGAAWNVRNSAHAWNVKCLAPAGRGPRRWKAELIDGMHEGTGCDRAGSRARVHCAQTRPRAQACTMRLLFCTGALR
jgi:hypothetical protein